MMDTAAAANGTTMNGAMDATMDTTMDTNMMDSMGAVQVQPAVPMGRLIDG